MINKNNGGAYQLTDSIAILTYMTRTVMTYQ